MAESMVQREKNSTVIQATYPLLDDCDKLGAFLTPAKDEFVGWMNDTDFWVPLNQFQLVGRNELIDAGINSDFVDQIIEATNCNHQYVIVRNHL